MKRAIFAGTFDPVHFGHIDVVKVASTLFDEVLWMVGENKTKNKPLNDAVGRFTMIEKVIAEEKFTNVKVSSMWYGDTLVATALKHEAGFLVRSFRLTADFEYELQLALINQKLDPSIQTVYIPPKQEHLHISSTAVRELSRLQAGRDKLASYVPEYLVSWVHPAQ
jgi:pantetheine-phosphate adenylyltransferase